MTTDKGIKLDFGKIEGFHYDQQAIYEEFLIFQANGDGIEVTEEDLLEAWRKAKDQTRYKIDD